MTMLPGARRATLIAAKRAANDDLHVGVQGRHSRAHRFSPMPRSEPQLSPYRPAVSAVFQFGFVDRTHSTASLVGAEFFATVIFMLHYRNAAVEPGYRWEAVACGESNLFCGDARNLRMPRTAVTRRMSWRQCRWPETARPAGMKSASSAAPCGPRNRVIKTLVSGQ